MPLTNTENPLLRDWTGPFAAPPFAEIDVEHFRPAFDSAIADMEYDRSKAIGLAMRNFLSEYAWE